MDGQINEFESKRTTRMSGNTMFYLNCRRHTCMCHVVYMLERNLLKNTYKFISVIIILLEVSFSGSKMLPTNLSVEVEGEVVRECLWKVDVTITFKRLKEEDFMTEWRRSLESKTDSSKRAHPLHIQMTLCKRMLALTSTLLYTWLQYVEVYPWSFHSKKGGRETKCQDCLLSTTRLPTHKE